MKITRSQLRQIIKEELSTAISERKEEEKTENVDPAIVEEMKDIMSVISDLREAHGRADTSGFQYSGDVKEIWIDDLYRLFRERLFRVERGYLGKPPRGVQMSISRIVGKMLGNMSYWLGDLTKATGRALTEFPRLMAGFAGLATKWDTMFKENIDHRLLEDFEDVELDIPDRYEKAKKNLVRQLRAALQIAPPSSFPFVSNLGDNGDNILQGLIESISEVVGGEYEEILPIMESFKQVIKHFRKEPTSREEQEALPAQLSKAAQFKDLFSEASRKWSEEMNWLSREKEDAAAAVKPKNQAKVAMAFLDEILMKIRSPILYDVYLRDLQGIVQDLRLQLSKINDEWGAIAGHRNEGKKVKITKSQLKQIIKEELENINENEFNPSERLPPGFTMTLPDPAAVEEASTKFAAIKELMASPIPRNPWAAHERLMQILEGIKEIVNTEPHRDATAELSAGEVAHTKGAPK